MLIVDAHLDLAWNALQWNRDLRLSAHTLRAQEAHLPGRGQNTVALPELRRGRVALCFATLLARSTGRTEPHIDYGSPAQAYAAAHGQLAYYRALEWQGEARVIGAVDQLEPHLVEWAEWEAAGADPGAAPPLGFVISMESADPILAPEDLPHWHAAGVRAIGPAHYGPGRYAGGTGTELPLTEPGRRLLSAMERLGILLDLTHLSDQAFWQALELYGGPVLASHNNCRALVPHQRQFTDEQLRAIIQRGGVIGAACDAWMLQPGWVTVGAGQARPPLESVVNQIDHICHLAGDAEHVGLGSDLDGGFGREQSPAEIDTIADLPRLADCLQARGFAEGEIAAILHGNWLRLLRQAWARA